MMKRFHLFLAVILLAGTQLIGQKIGYVNTQAIIEQLPQVKEASAELEAAQKQYEKQIQDKYASFQTKYQALERKQAQGEISPKQLETEAQALQQEERDIAKFQQDIQQKLLQKNETLLKPIRDRVQSAIDEVAKENGFAYIFDQSSGVILYADESADVSAQVKAKLGM